MKILGILQYFSYIMAVSFICVGNRSTWRRPPNCRKSLTNLSHNSYNDKMSTHQVIMHQKDEIQFLVLY